MRRWFAGLLSAGLVLAVLSVPTAAPEAASSKVQRAKIVKLRTALKRVKKQRNQARSERATAIQERDQARAAVNSTVGQQVAEVASRGSIGELHPLVLEPVRVNWPCGATLFQGETFYGLDVDLIDYNEDFDEVRCSP